MKMAQAGGSAVDELTATASATELREACAPSVPINAILGSQSVAIDRSPFDTDWAAVDGAPGARKVLNALAASGARTAASQTAKLEAVNGWVNRRIKHRDDRDLYGRADYWAPAAETLRRGSGDCEDFAIAKMELLAALGVGRDDMRLVVARDLVRNADHAVLVVKLGDGAVMLDNMTDRLLDARLPNDYRPIMSFSRNRKWVHGYAVPAARPVRMASAVVVRPDVQAVTVEPEFEPLSLALLSVPLAPPSGLSARV
ncbi:MAG TPA: transglutaminase-like cysteine peptidase [Sphingorhabdus sp.]|nr:transglutaminase-like cysteine peptidase [Sphingorhabdus sp.]